MAPIATGSHDAPARQAYDQARARGRAAKTRTAVRMAVDRRGVVADDGGAREVADHARQRGGDDGQAHERRVDLVPARLAEAGGGQRGLGRRHEDPHDEHRGLGQKGQDADAEGRRQRPSSRGRACRGPGACGRRATEASPANAAADGTMPARCATTAMTTTSETRGP